MQRARNASDAIACFNARSRCARRDAKCMAPDQPNATSLETRVLLPKSRELWGRGIDREERAAAVVVLCA
jgi:hypothetical protein